MGRRLYRRPRHHRHPQRVPGPFRDRSVQRALLGDHRGRAREQCRRRRSFRQARRQRPHLERAREAVPARPCGLRFLLWQRNHRARERGLARAVLSGHVAAQRRQSGRRGSGRAPRLSSRLPVGGDDRALSRPRSASLAGADAARGDRALRHADRDRADALSAVLAELSARLYGDGAAGVSRLFRQASRPAAARQGRRGVLQSRLVPRRGNEPLEGRAPHRQSLAGLLGLRPRDGERRPAQDEPETLSGAEGSCERSRRSRRPKPTTRSPLQPRAIPSRPISIATRRKAAWRPRPSRT